MNDPDPRIIKTFINIIAGVGIALFIMTNIPKPTLEWMSDEIGTNYQKLVQPAIVGLYKVMPLLIPSFIYSSP